MSEKEFQPGEAVPESGLYMVKHKEHRDDHEVTLIAEEHFPPCSVCHQAVRFRLSRPAKTIREDRNFQARKSARKH